MLFHLYGFFIGLGIISGILVVEKIMDSTHSINSVQANSPQIKKFSILQLPTGILPTLLLFGLIGARLYHVIDFWDFYNKNPIKIFYIWQGGLGIFGAIIGGIMGLLIFAKMKKTKLKQVFSWLDLGVIGLSLGQAIGRWGNYFNQELYGLPSNLPWSIKIPLEKRLADFESFSFYHPLFFYESLGTFLIFLFLYYWAVVKKRLNRPGDVFFAYLFFYSCLRFVLDFLRINPWRAGVFTTAQLISLILIIIVIIRLTVVKHKNNL